MDELSAFETLAQIALGIGGFSGVVVAVSDRSADQPRADALRILSLLVVSLGALVLALLPSGLALADVPPSFIWRAGSTVAVVGVLAWGAYFPRRMRVLPRGVLFPTPVWVAVASSSVLNLVAQLLNASGLFPRAAASIYYFDIVWALLFSAAVFVNVVFRRPGRT